MKRGGGIKGLDDKSNGMEILMTDSGEAFAKIKPTGLSAMSGLASNPANRQIA